VELKAAAVLHVGACDNAAGAYPLAKKKQTMEFLREIMHLRARTNTIGAVARVRNALAAATHAFFQGRGFLYVHTPVLTASDCEGAGEMFQARACPGAPLGGACGCRAAPSHAARIMASPLLPTAAPFQTRARATRACGRPPACRAGGLE